MHVKSVNKAHPNIVSPTLMPPKRSIPSALLRQRTIFPRFSWQTTLRSLRIHCYSLLQTIFVFSAGALTMFACLLATSPAGGEDVGTGVEVSYNSSGFHGEEMWCWMWNALEMDINWTGWYWTSTWSNDQTSFSPTPWRKKRVRRFSVIPPVAICCEAVISFFLLQKIFLFATIIHALI